MDGRGRAPARDYAGAHQDWETEQIGVLLGTVVACLLETFPNDYYRRCAFSAYALRALLARQGIVSHAVGGRFSALVVARDESRYALQGFEDGPEPLPHIWVETGRWLIDLGPYFLPWGSPFPLVLMPPLIWDRCNPLPRGLRYAAIETVSDAAPFSIDAAVQQQAEAFASQCLGYRHDAAPFPFWIASDPAALTRAAAAGDRWAIALRKFEEGSSLLD